MDLRYYRWLMIAKMDGICSETGKPFKAGEKIIYIKGVKGLHRAYTYSESSNFYKNNCNDIRTGYSINWI